MSPNTPMGPNGRNDRAPVHNHETGRDEMKTTDPNGNSPDETLVRDALQDHPWPKASSGLMARLKAAPAEAQREIISSEAAPGSASKALRQEHSRQQIAWFETAGAIAIVAAVVVVILRGTGIGIAPADAPDALDRSATATVEGNPAIGPRPLDEPTPVSETEGTVDAGTAELSVPMPPEGTRLFRSVAELLADPPVAGETVWVDAYHPEAITTLEGSWKAKDCPPYSISPLLDGPHLHQLNFYGTMRLNLPPDPFGATGLMAVELDAAGAVDPLADLPRFGRLVVHLEDSIMAHCPAGAQVAIIERVAHVFQPKVDWLAKYEAIQMSKTWIESGGSAFVRLGDDGRPETVGQYRIRIPIGLESYEVTDERAALGTTDGVYHPEHPDHPIMISRYTREHPGYSSQLKRLRDLEILGPLNTVHALRPEQRTPKTTFVLDGFVHAPPLDKPETAQALAEVDDVIYEIEMTLPDDLVAAQTLLWWFEAVIERLTILPPERDDDVTLSMEVSALELRSVLTVDFELTKVAARDETVMIGGFNGLAIASIYRQGFPRSMRRYRPSSPVELGLVSDSVLERFAARMTAGDLDAARALLSSEEAGWMVHSMALSGGYGYAAIEWPPLSGLVSLHAIDLSEEEPTLVDAVWLEAAADSIVSAITGHEMEPVGDRLLIASSAGLFSVDISDPASLVADVPIEGLREMYFDLAVSPDHERAWVSVPQLDAGGLIELDISDPASPQRSGELRDDAAYFDIETNGLTTFVTTGSGTDDIRVLDVSGDGDPTMVGSKQLDAENILRFALLGDRLVVAGTNLLEDLRYPGPDDPLGLGQTGLLVYDIGTPADPVLLETIATPNGVTAFDVDGGLLFAATNKNGVRVYGIDDKR